MFPHAVSLNYQSFQDESSIDKQDFCRDNQVLIQGQLQISNTLEDFKSSNKKTVLSDYSKVMWKALTSLELQSEVDSNLANYLIRFLFLTFADLKKYHYYYWCAFPAMNYPQSCFKVIPNSEKISSFFTVPELENIVNKYSELNIHQRMFFLLIKGIENDGTEFTKLENFNNFWSLDNVRRLESLKSYSVYFAFTDASRKANKYGWILRNFIAYLFVRLTQLSSQIQEHSFVSSFISNIGFVSHLKVIAFRLSEKLLVRKDDHLSKIIDEISQESVLLKLSLGKSPSSQGGLSFIPIEDASIEKEQILNLQEEFFALIREEINPNSEFLPPFVGFEFNEELGKYLPKFVDCSRQLDPKLLASEAVHLNLKLMKWRLQPAIDLDLVRDTKCLLLGSGTLGCNIARSLVAWGVSKITFVDSGTVSYSNPVRQTLFTFEDCIPDKDGNLKPKAFTASEALKRICPTCDSTGHKLSIPMPGHSVAPNQYQAVYEDFRKLESLIDEHDVLFLLTDTRESRWLPSLIGASKHKIIINCALGFDTFLVQRHGLRFRCDNEIDMKSPFASQYREVIENSSFNDDSVLMGQQLGCYFCNDVFAPGNVSFFEYFLKFQGFSYIFFVFLEHTRSYFGSTMHCNSSWSVNDCCWSCSRTLDWPTSTSRQRFSAGNHTHKQHKLQRF